MKEDALDTNCKLVFWANRLIRFSGIPCLMGSGIINIDVAFVQVTPPDDAGYCSLGVAVDVARHAIEQADLVALFRWDEASFLRNTEGSPIRRIGYERWLRNLAVGLGNASSSIPVIEALKSRRQHPCEVVREHVEWALAQHGAT